MPRDAFEGYGEPVKFDPTEPLDQEENGLTGRINSDLAFEEALKVILKTEDAMAQDQDEERPLDHRE